MLCIVVFSHNTTLELINYEIYLHVLIIMNFSVVYRIDIGLAKLSQLSNVVSSLTLSVGTGVIGYNWYLSSQVFIECITIYFQILPLVTIIYYIWYVFSFVAVYVIGPGDQGILYEHRELEFGDHHNQSALLEAVALIKEYKEKKKEL